MSLVACPTGSGAFRPTATCGGVALGSHGGSKGPGRPSLLFGRQDVGSSFPDALSHCLSVGSTPPSQIAQRLASSTSVSKTGQRSLPNFLARISHFLLRSGSL